MNQFKTVWEPATDKWGEEFPLSLYLKLVDISKRANQLVFKKVSKDDNRGSEANATELHVELTVINEIFG